MAGKWFYFLKRLLQPWAGGLIQSFLQGGLHELCALSIYHNTLQHKNSHFYGITDINDILIPPFYLTVMRNWYMMLPIEKGQYYQVTLADVDWYTNWGIGQVVSLLASSISKHFQPSRGCSQIFLPSVFPYSNRGASTWIYDHAIYNKNTQAERGRFLATVPNL